MKKILTLLLAAALLLGILAGCAPEDTAYVPTGDALEDENAPTATVKPPEVVEDTMSLVYYPARTLNPFQSTDYTNRVLFGLIYQGLFAVNEDYEAAPILCQSYRVSADMKTYTFTLANAYFSDGAALTAEDVVASLKAAQQSPYFGNRLQHVTSITAQAGEVVIGLDVPMENLPILLDIPVVKASEVQASNPLGTGPFLLDSSSQGKWLRRQPGWWCNAQTAFILYKISCFQNGFMFACFVPQSIFSGTAAKIKMKNKFSPRQREKSPKKRQQKSEFQHIQ